MSVDALFELAWKSAVVAVLALLLIRWSHQRSAAERSAIGLVALLALLVLPILVLAVPRWQLPVLGDAAVASAADAPVGPQAEAPAPAHTGTMTAPAFAGIAMRPQVASHSTVLPAYSASSEVGTTRVPWLLLYATPAAALLLILLAASRRLSGLRARALPVTDAAWLRALQSTRQRLGVRRRVELLSTVELDSAVSWGLLRPVIVLDKRTATQVSACHAEALLAHELAHVARLDWLQLLLARLVIALYWFNPLVWLLARRCHQLQEMAADDAVLNSQVPGVDYAALLVQAARRQLHSPLLAHAVAPAPSALKQRVIRVLDQGLRRSPALLAWSAACGLGALALVMPLAAVLPVPASAASAPMVTPMMLNAGAAASELELGWRVSAHKSGSPERVQLSLDFTSGDDRHHSSHGQPLSELQGLSFEQLTAAQPVAVQFELVREAGRLQCSGMAAQLDGSGTCRFVTDDAYADTLESAGIGRPSARQQLELALQNVSLTLVHELERQAYPRPTIEKLIEAGIHGVDSAWLQALDGVGMRLDGIDSLVEFRIHGVDASYIRQLRALGPQLANLRPEQWVEMRIHGITPDSVQQLVQLGYTDLGAPQLVEMAIHGAGPEMVGELAGLGYRDIDARQLVEMRIHGVGPEFVRELAALGYPSESPRQLVEMRIHGVTTKFIRELATLGYQNLSPRQLVNLRIHDVSPEFIRDQRAQSGTTMTVEELLDRRIHGRY